MVDPTLAASLQMLYETLQDIANTAQTEADHETAVLASLNESREEQKVSVPPEEGDAMGGRARSDTITTTTTSKSQASKKKGKKKAKQAVSPASTPSLSMITTTSSSDSTQPKSPSSIMSSPEDVLVSKENVNQDALQFLQAALPQISTAKLINALSQSANQTDEGSAENEGVMNNMNMWSLISSLLASEDARERDERGFDFSEEASSPFSGELDLDLQYDNEQDRLAIQALLDSDLAAAQELRDNEENAYKAYLAQMDEDERIARELAAQMDMENGPRFYKKGETNEEDGWVTSKAKGKKKATKVKTTQVAPKGGELKITLNDVRQKGHISAPAPTTPSASGTQKEGDGQVVGGEAVPLPLLSFPSLATYLASLIPKDKSPSSLLATPVGRSKGEKGGATLAEYIQNVFLNERALISKYGGRVYTAVRRCLEQVVEVAEAEAAALAKVRAEAEERARATEEIEGATKVEEQLSQEDQSGRGEEEGDPPPKQRRKGKGFPPANTPQPPPRKAKGRVMTVTDRSIAEEREPGGLLDGASESGSASGGSQDGGNDGTRIEEDESQTLLFTLLDILLPEYALVDGTTQPYVDVHQLLSDIELCIEVTDVGEDALDLAKLLCELHVSDSDPKKEVWRVMQMFDGEGSVERRERRVLSYAETVGKTRLRQAATTTGVMNERKTGDVELARPGVVVLEQVDEKKKHKPSPYQWQAVPVKKSAPAQPKMLLPHLPTYKRDVNGIKQQDDGLVWLKGMVVPGWDRSVLGSGGRGKAAEYEEAEREYRQKIRENMRRRDELLHEAARMYNRGFGGGDKVYGRGRGSGKVKGGDIAWYFAERAREFQEAARRESVNAAKAMVKRKQILSGDHDTVDLHGTTVPEATEIVLEILESRERGRQLKIVTGRGNHSATGQSVLKPALKKRLVEEGWTVSTWDAGLFVR